MSNYLACQSQNKKKHDMIADNAQNKNRNMFGIILPGFFF